MLNNRKKTFSFKTKIFLIVNLLLVLYISIAFGENNLVSKGEILHGIKQKLEGKQEQIENWSGDPSTYQIIQCKAGLGMRILMIKQKRDSYLCGSAALVNANNELFCLDMFLQEKSKYNQFMSKSNITIRTLQEASDLFVLFLIASKNYLLVSEYSGCSTKKICDIAYGIYDVSKLNRIKRLTKKYNNKFIKIQNEKYSGKFIVYRKHIADPLVEQKGEVLLFKVIINKNGQITEFSEKSIKND